MRKHTGFFIMWIVGYVFILCVAAFLMAYGGTLFYERIIRGNMPDFARIDREKPRYWYEIDGFNIIQHQTQPKQED